MREKTIGCRVGASKTIGSVCCGADFECTVLWALLRTDEQAKQAELINEHDSGKGAWRQVSRPWNFVFGKGLSRLQKWPRETPIHPSPLTLRTPFKGGRNKRTPFLCLMPEAVFSSWFSPPVKIPPFKGVVISLRDSYSIQPILRQTQDDKKSPSANSG